MGNTGRRGLNRVIQVNTARSGRSAAPTRSRADGGQLQTERRPTAELGSRECPSGTRRNTPHDRGRKGGGRERGRRGATGGKTPARRDADEGEDARDSPCSNRSKMQGDAAKNPADELMQNTKPDSTDTRELKKEGTEGQK